MCSPKGKKFSGLFLCLRVISISAVESQIIQAFLNVN
jgi:hypothetical protein